MVLVQAMTMDFLKFLFINEDFAFEFIYTPPFLYFVNAVGGGFLELLAPRGGPVYQGYCVTMAHLSWTIHLWFGCRYCRDRTSREANLLADKEEGAETFARVHDREQPGTQPSLA